MTVAADSQGKQALLLPSLEEGVRKVAIVCKKSLPILPVCNYYATKITSLGLFLVGETGAGGGGGL